MNDIAYILKIESIPFDYFKAIKYIALVIMVVNLRNYYY